MVAAVTRPLTISERRSLASYRGWTTRREGKQAEARCPDCGEKIEGSAVDHIKRKHVDLYARRARKFGDML